MKKYNCNNTLDYAHEASRMCRTFDKCKNCGGCPFAETPCEIFDITPEHIKRVQAWSDAHPEITLTDKQVEILKALDLLGFRYIAQDSNTTMLAYAERPLKGPIVWNSGERSLCFNDFKDEVIGIVSPLVSWSDEEPLNIVEVLQQAKEVHP